MNVCTMYTCTHTYTTVWPISINILNMEGQLTYAVVIYLDITSATTLKARPTLHSCFIYKYMKCSLVCNLVLKVPSVNICNITYVIV